MYRFSKDGKMIIPLRERKKGTTNCQEKGVRYVVTEAFCPNGCCIIDKDHEIHGSPGLRIKFKRQGMEGECILSAIEGDFDKIILSGKLDNGLKYDLSCSHCGAIYSKLVNCNCQPDAEMVVIGLTPKLDFNNAISFCNVTGCDNGTFIKSEDVIRHVRLSGYSLHNS